MGFFSDLLGTSKTEFDPSRAINAGAEANIKAAQETAKLNQINEYNPFGSVTYSGDIGSPNRTRTTSLSASGQRQFDAQNRIAETLGIRAENLARFVPQDQFTLKGLPKAPGVDDFSADRDRVTEAYFNRAADRVNPLYDQRRKELEAQLANQGFSRGSEAFGRELGNFNQERNNAFNDLSLGALAAGGQEQSRLFGLGQAARSQGINERLLERGQPLNEVTALLGGFQTQVPNFGANPQVNVQPVDAAGAYGLDAQFANDANARKSALFGNVLAAGGKAAGAYYGARG